MNCPQSISEFADISADTVRSPEHDPEPSAALFVDNLSPAQIAELRAAWEAGRKIPLKHLHLVRIGSQAETSPIARAISFAGADGQHARIDG